MSSFNGAGSIGSAAWYFDALEAPVKELHWFEKSAHMIPFEEPAKFNALLSHTVPGRH